MGSNHGFHQKCIISTLFGYYILSRSHKKKMDVYILSWYPKMKLDIISYPDPYPYPCFNTCKKVWYIFLPFSLNFYFKSIKLVSIPLNSFLDETVGEKSVLKRAKTIMSNVKFHGMFHNFISVISIHKRYGYDFSRIFR